jgi:glycerophosphoryl diester phosphodiesterase
MVFRDPDLGCRTDGHGPLRARTLAELKRLDVAYGYSPDGGRTFPLRGRGIGGMPTVEEVLREVPKSELIFRFVGSDPAGADAVVGALKRAGAASAERFGFEGAPGVIARVGELLPGAWTFDPRPSGTCLADYVRIGWTSYVPGSCRGATVAIVLGDRWKLWGWPDRFLDASSPSARGR